MFKEINRNSKKTEIMEKEFIPYEIALELKELDFDEPCLSYYENNGKNSLLVTDSVNFTNTDLKVEGISSPLYQQAFRWFREKYNLHSTIALISNSDTERRYMVMIDYIYPHKAIMEFEEYETYEEAELECLKKLIQIVKEQK